MNAIAYGSQRVTDSGRIETVASVARVLPLPVAPVPISGFRIEETDTGARIVDARGQSYGEFTSAALARTTLSFLSR